ncbi:MAG TPA: rod shape-determining protein MreD [bacterium]|nr:rod shape-determining protein MreD [bacterium]
MKALAYGGVGLLALWLQISVAPLIALWGIRPNLVLVSLVVLGLRWKDPGLFVYGAVCGVTLDSFSHGVLGVYGTSLFVAAWAVRWAGGSFYEDNLALGVLTVLGVSLLETVVAVSIFRILDAGVPWWNWVLARGVPEALYSAAVAPLAFWAMARLERRFRMRSRI